MNELVQRPITRSKFGTEWRSRALSVLGMVALILGLWSLSSASAHATCSTSSNRIDNPKTKKRNENTDDIFVLRHGLVTALGTETVYGGGDGENSYLGYARNEGYVELSGGPGRLSVHGATSDGALNASVSLDEQDGPGVCINDNRAP